MHFVMLLQVTINQVEAGLETNLTINKVETFFHKQKEKLFTRTKFSDAIKCCMNAAIDTFHQYKTRCALKMIDVVNV